AAAVGLRRARVVLRAQRIHPQARDVRRRDVARLVAQLRGLDGALEQRDVVPRYRRLVLREREVVVRRAQREQLLAQHVGVILRRGGLGAPRLRDAQLALVAALDQLVEPDRRVDRLVAIRTAADADLGIDLRHSQAQVRIGTRARRDGVRLRALERAPREAHVAVA